MNKLFQAAALVLVVGLTACQDCKKMTKDVLQPTSAAETLLNTFNNGTDVANGCPALLDILKTTPAGAAVIRDMAANKFTDSYTTCERWVTGTRWEVRCGYYGHHQICHSFPVVYQYCAAYDTHTTHDPGYAQALDLSAKLEVMFDQANNMCGQAANGQLNAAYASSRDLLTNLETRIGPAGDQVYALACD